MPGLFVCSSAKCQQRELDSAGKDVWFEEGCSLRQEPTSSKWSTPFTLTIKMPKLQTVVCTLAILGAVGTVVWVGLHETLNHPQGPTAPAPPGKDDPKVTDWISAAFTAFGSLATAGALWLGAVTFRRQVRDQHRAQASAVSASVEQSSQDHGVLILSAHNGSSLPIYEVLLMARDVQDNYVDQDFRNVLPRDGGFSFQKRTNGILLRCRVYFRDSAGQRWSREASGQLKELPD